MAAEYAIRAWPHALYDGTNGAEVLAELTAWDVGSSILSEGGGVLVVRNSSTDDPISLSVGDRVNIAQWWKVTPAQWAAEYVKV